MKAFIELVKETFQEWQEDKASRLAASLAYFTIFSIAPLLIVVIAVVGAVYGRDAAQGQIVTQLQGLLGQDGAQVVQEMVQNASQPQSGTVATIIGIVTLLLGASGVFGALQDSLNTIWEVAPKPGRGIRQILHDRVLSFTMVLAIGFLLLVSLVVSAALSAFDQVIADALPGGDWVARGVNLAISFSVITLLFAMMFKFLPDAEVRWRDVWVGAAVTAALFTLGKFLIGLYLGNSSVASVYGAAGSLVVLLIWIFYSAQILFLCAEFTQVYAKRYGSGSQPSKNAIRVTEAQRAQQGITRQHVIDPPREPEVSERRWDEVH